MDELARRIERPPEDPFTPDTIVVHSQGLENWLAMQLAQRHGICANVEFLFPEQLVARVLGHDQSGFSEEILWSLLTALPGRIEHPDFEAIRSYVEADGPAWVQRRTYELAEQVARLFARYSIYRPELVKRWSSGHQDGWESHLWRAVAATTGDFTTSPEGYRGRVFIFSVSTLAPVHVGLLSSLALTNEVHLFVLSPSPSYWRQVAQASEQLRAEETMPKELTLTTGNPLRASLGTLGRDFQVALEKNGYQDHALYEEPRSSTLLHALQEDLYHNVSPRPRDLQADDSLQFHACHSPLRQVQVLRDLLLDAFEEMPDLQPREVLVMAPDIEVYAPLVKAVFSDGEVDPSTHAGGLPLIRHALADRGLRSQNPVAEALSALLELADTRLEASAVLDLLARPPVRRRFGIEADQLATVQRWLSEVGVRWGLDSEHRKEQDQPVTEEYTWRFGLDRLLLGQALTEGDELVLGLVPHNLEGKDHRELLDRLVEYSEALLELYRELEQPRTVTGWCALLREAQERFTLDHEWLIEQVVDGLWQMAEGAAAAGFEAKLDLPTFRAMLMGRFELREPGEGFLRGDVTFCQLTPMRSLPFRVVAMLGMDDGVFPRVRHQLGFDRMAQEPRLGDRSAREDDRGLMLESLLSARDRLLILYTGRGIRDDAPRPPAMPVAELIEVAGATWPEGKESLIRQHPLHPFSPRNFQPPRPLAHDRRALEAAGCWLRGRVDPVEPAPLLKGPLKPPAAESVVELDQLRRFFEHPVRYLCERRLDLWLRQETEELEDRAPRRLDPLQKWALRDRLLSWIWEGVELRTAGWERARRMALLPLGMPGRLLYEEVAGEAEAIAAAATDLRSEPLSSPLDLDLHFGSSQLVGRVGELYGGTRVSAQAGGVRARQRFGLWLEHLALNAGGGGHSSRLVGNGSTAGFRPLPQPEAHRILARLLECYHDGLVRPLPFFPKFAERWMGYLPKSGEVGAARRLRRVWSDFIHKECPYTRAFLGPEFPLECSASARQLAKELWTPLLEAQDE